MQVKKIINCTPHDIVVYDDDGKTVIVTIPRSEPIRLKEIDEEAGEIKIIDTERSIRIPLIARDFVCPSITPPDDGDGGGDGFEVYIVSLPMLMMLALKADDLPRSVLFVAPDTGSGAVRDEKGQIIGTKRFITLKQLINK